MEEACALIFAANGVKGCVDFSPISEFDSIKLPKITRLIDLTVFRHISTKLKSVTCPISYEFTSENSTLQVSI